MVEPPHRSRLVPATKVALLYANVLEVLVELIISLFKSVCKLGNDFQFRLAAKLNLNP
jgi:hypothetical protein